MKKEKFIQVVEKISRHKARKKIFELYNWGEPMLHPEVDDFVRIAKAKGFEVWLSSNLNFNNSNVSSIKKMREEILKKYLGIKSLNHIQQYLERSTIYPTKKRGTLKWPR